MPTITEVVKALKQAVQQQNIPLRHPEGTTWGFTPERAWEEYLRHVIANNIFRDTEGKSGYGQREKDYSNRNS